MGMFSLLTITNLLCIYDYMLKSWLTEGIPDIFTFSAVLRFFSRHQMDIFPMTHNFREINIV